MIIKTGADSVVQDQRSASGWSHMKLRDGYIMYTGQANTRWDDRERDIGPCVYVTYSRVESICSND